LSKLLELVCAEVTHLVFHFVIEIAYQLSSAESRCALVFGIIKSILKIVDFFRKSLFVMVVLFHLVDGQTKSFMHILLFLLFISFTKQ